MRYGREHKEQTRRRILDAAASLFRQHGIDGVGVDAIMREAGLTHGGFYGHFASKEELAGEVFADTLARSAERWRSAAEREQGAETLQRIAAAYLDHERVRVKESGCVLPALGPELARRSSNLASVTQSIRAMTQALADCRGEGGVAYRRALADLSAMVGAVVLARLVDDPEFGTTILDAALESVLGSQTPP